MRVRVGALLAVALLSGCDHTAPFDSPGAPNPGPRGTGNPVQVTYNLGTDLRPSWLPDGSGFFYSLERTDRKDGDLCLALMPATGGVVQQQICDRTPTSDDSIATFASAAAEADGRLAYVREGTPLVPASIAPRTIEIRLGTRSAPTGAIVKSLPYTAPSGRIHLGLEWLQWLGATQLLYLGEEVRYERDCSSCTVDTVRVGLEIVTIAPGTGALVILPGTDGATSVAVAGSDTIYYTRASTTMIERRVLSTGAVTPVFDFGVAVRDVTTGGGRLAAVTGSGLWLVLPGSGVTELTAPGVTRFRRPALSPDGGRLVVEGYTNSSRSANLWLFDLP